MIESRKEIKLEGILDMVEGGGTFITAFVEKDGFTSEDTYDLNDILKEFEHESVIIRIESTNKGDFKIE